MICPISIQGGMVSCVCEPSVLRDLSESRMGNRNGNSLDKGLSILQGVHDSHHTRCHVKIQEFLEPENDFLLSFGVIPGSNLNVQPKERLNRHYSTVRDYLLHQQLAIFQLVFELLHSGFKFNPEQCTEPTADLCFCIRTVTSGHL